MQNFFTVFYLVAEYMRPQSMYEGLSGAPLALIGALGMAFALIIKKDKVSAISPVNYIMVGFLTWFIISVFFSKEKEYALPFMIDFLKIVVIYYLLINLLNNKKYLYVFTITFLLLGFKLVQFAVRIWVSKGFYSDPRGLYEGAGFATGFFGNPNDLGVLLNVLFGLSFYMFFYDETKIWNRFPMKWFHGIHAFLIPLAILSTSSRAATLAFGCILMAILFKSKRKMAGIVLAVAFVAAYITFIPPDNWARFEEIGSETDTTGQTRIWLWQSGIRMANENPITGVGPGNFQYMNMFEYQNGLHEQQHNVFIQALSELGYPGLLILFILIYLGFINQRKARDQLIEKRNTDRFLLGLSHGIDVALIGFFANGFFLTVLYYPIFWNLLAVSVATRNITKTDVPQDTTESKIQKKLVPFAKNP